MGPAAIKLTTTQKVFSIACLTALLWGSDFAWSQRSSELSADLPNTRTMATQDKVEGLFNAGDFERAFFIYRNELAPIGDKYSQYMIGYMYLSGLGVDEDPVLASAWYRLAAERGTPEFIAVRDQLLSSFGGEEMSRSDVEYIKLRIEYSDLAVLLSSVKRNLKEVEARTGSRLQSGNSAMMMVATPSGRTQSAADYYSALYTKLEDRLKLMQELGDFQDMETDPKRVNLRELERRVKERIESLN